MRQRRVFDLDWVLVGAATVVFANGVLVVVGIAALIGGGCV